MEEGLGGVREMIEGFEPTAASVEQMKGECSELQEAVSGLREQCEAIEAVSGELSS